MAEPRDAGSRDWYREYYRRHGADRNDVLRNPEVLFQHLGFEASVLQALRAAGPLDRRTVTVLDVGCGGRGTLVRFSQLGFHPANLCGVDLRKERLAEARSNYPHLRFACADGAALPFPAEQFDLVMEETMFIQITDPALAARVATDMLRVTRPGGHLLLVDWRYSDPRRTDYAALSLGRIRSLFGVGTATTLASHTRGALVPPVGRLLSKHAPWAYFPVARLMPVLAGQTATLLRKA